MQWREISWRTEETFQRWEQLGQGMEGGVIYLRGQAKSVADAVRVVRIKDADALRLSLLLARAGISGDAKEFRLYMPRKKEK